MSGNSDHRRDATGAGAGPLSGLRVADLGIITAGAACTQLLADFGADVIKVESAGHPDPFRSWTALGAPAADPAGVEGTLFRTVNRNKRSVSIDLKTLRGREVFLRLVACSDCVVENFRRGVLDRLRLTFSDLAAANPRIVLLSLSSQGTTGPTRSFRSYGSTLEALGGLASLTGYELGPPTWSTNKVNYPDQAVSLLAPSLVLEAVRRARRAGRGSWVDLSQRELVTSMVGDHLAWHSLTGAQEERKGNRGDRGVEVCCRCQGEDAWVAVSIDDDRTWGAFCQVTGAASASDPRFATAASRQAHEREVGGIVHRWCAGLTKEAAMRVLQDAGVPAAAVFGGDELLGNEQLAALGFFQPVQTPGGGTERQRGFPCRIDGRGGTVRRGAPVLGEHTREVLGDLLRYRDEEIEELAREGAVGLRSRGINGRGYRNAGRTGA